jgi:hypothetical protein
MPQSGAAGFAARRPQAGEIDFEINHDGMSTTAEIRCNGFRRRPLQTSRD